MSSEGLASFLSPPCQVLACQPLIRFYLLEEACSELPSGNDRTSMNRAVPRSPSIVMWLVLPLFCQGGGTAAGSQLPCGEVCCFHFPAVPTLGKLLISLCLDCFLCKMETIVPTSKGWGRDEIMKCVDLVLTMNLKSRWYLFLLSEYGNWIFFPFALLISTLSCLETSSFVCLSSRTPRAFKICCYSCLCPCPTFSTRF